MRFETRLWIRAVLTAIVTLVVAASATALPSQGVEPVMRHATEPSTGSMVAAAIVVLATRRRRKKRSR